MKFALIILLLTSLVQASFGQHFSDGGLVDVASVRSMAVGDYDKDGDDDVLGADSRDPGHSLKLWRLTNGVFEPIRVSELGLPARASTVDWVDYDADGDVDAFISYRYNVGAIGHFYLNNNGHFTKLANNLPTNIGSPVYEWGDYEDDGDLDVLISGEESQVRIRVFINEEDSFKEKLLDRNSPSGPATWVDFDNDHDLDVYVLRFYDGFSMGGIFENTTDGLKFKISLPPHAFGSADWADFDNDGDPDLLMKGTVDINVPSAGIYVNQDNKTFTKLATVNITPTSRGCTRWVDFDKDGDLDIFNSGDNGNGELYVRNNGTYTKVQNIGLPTGIFWTAAFIDYDKDNDLDIFAGFEVMPRIYRNDAGSNPVPLSGGVPAPAVDFVAMPVSATDILLSFSDFATNENTWVVEIRNGDAAAFQQLTNISPQANTTTLTYTANSLTSGIRYAFRVRSENASGSSRFSEIVYAYTTSADFVKTDITSTFDKMSLPGWVDLDKDNDMDLVFYGHKGSQSTPSEVFTMRSNAGTLGLIGNNIPKVRVLDMDWADFDSDGDQDLLLYGSTSNDIFSNTGTVHILRNDGTFWFEAVKTISGASIEGPGVARWADLNNDGQIDFFLSKGRFITPFINDLGQFTQKEGYDIPRLLTREVASADFTGDGLTDFVFSGSTVSQFDPYIPQAVVSTNLGNNKFKTTQVLVEAGYSTVRSGDFDADGDPDLIAMGFDLPPTVFWNDGQGMLTKSADNDLPIINSGDMEAGDLDNDGDLDVVVGGATINGSMINKVFLNDGHGVFSESNIGLTPMRDVDYALGDVDMDNDLDIIEMGVVPSGPDLVVKASVIKNNTAAVNDWPNPPIITNVVQKVDGLLVEWTGGADETDAVTANMYVKTPDNEYRFNVVTERTTGVLRLPSKGNLTSRKALIKHLFIGNYEIGIQSVDNSFMGSFFATTTFEVKPIKPELVTTDPVACEKGKTTLEVAGQHIVWYSDTSLDYHKIIAEANQATVDVGKNDTTFYVTQLFFTNGNSGTHGPILPVNVKVLSQVRDPITALQEGLLAPLGDEYQWIRNDTTLKGETSRKITTTMPGRYRIKVKRGPCVSDTINYVLQPSKPLLTYPPQGCATKTHTVKAKGKSIVWYDRAGKELSALMDSITFTFLRESDTVVFAAQWVNNVRSEKAKARWLVYKTPFNVLTTNNGVITASEGMSYQWYLNDGKIDGATSRTFTATNDGAYYVEVSNGTCITKSRMFTYTALENVDVVNIGYDRQSELLFIRSGQAKPIEIVIYDATGRQLPSSLDQLTNDTHTVSLKGATTGMYIVNVRLDDNKMFRAKFIKH